MLIVVELFKELIAFYGNPASLLNVTVLWHVDTYVPLLQESVTLHFVFMDRVIFSIKGIISLIFVIVRC